MQIVHFKRLCVCVFLCSCYEGLAVPTNSALFHKVDPGGSVMLYSTSTIQVASIMECARKCLEQNCSCYSYSIQSCSIGQCNSTNKTTIPSQEIYVPCYNSDGFALITMGSVCACVWFSTVKTDYITARDDCRDKDAHLYTVKTMDKLEWLQSNYLYMATWIGLNDINVEGTYMWEDDNTACSKSWIQQTFAPGEPSNYNPYSKSSEDCITFNYYIKMLLNDDNCLLNYTYICEKSFFNFP
ncbi:C-type lectin domain family 4 member M [Biomphalaria glabrata]|nr:C-type lectin domain family 4 member M [Biomphalaria glabrata]